MPAPQSAEEALENLCGETLANRYLIEHKLGEGAMGAVYRARHIKVGRPFAVKVLHPRFLEDKKTLQRFEREAELAGRLHHPNVIGVVDVGDTHGLRYMVMDFAEGPDLATMMTEAPFPTPRIVHLVRQMLEGLYHAHQQGLIHRDFKPENVIVETDTHGADVPRIVDFGIAILREGGDSPESPGRLTTNGLVLGTPHYMAPEQAVADPVDHRIDLFALGIVIYEMLCGKLPFDGSGAEVARANLLLDPPRIAERVPFLEVDPLLEAFARRLMAKKRDARPPTAKAARDLLDLIDRDRAAAAAALGVPLAARPPMTTQPTRQVVDKASTESPRQVPPFEQAIAVAVPEAVAERNIDTEPVGRPLPAKKRPWPLVGAVIAGVAVLGGGVYVMVAGKDKAPVKEPEPIVAKAAEVQAVAPPPQPPPEPKREPEPQPEPQPPPQPQPEPQPQPQPQKAIEHPTKAKKPPRDGTKAKPVEVKPVEIKPVATKAIDEPKVVETKTVAPDAQVTAGQLATRFNRVGQRLKALAKTRPDDVADLQAKYSLITIQDAMTTPEKIKSASAQLDRIEAALAKLR